MTKKVWVEVALNGMWGKAAQPNIPVTVDEVIADGVACIQAGAAILHLHAIDPVTGKQNDDPEIYEAIFRGIRAKTDGIVYPTMPLDLYDGWTDRYQSADELGRRGLLEWAVVDPGSLNINAVDAASKQLHGKGVVYVNTDAEIRRGMQLATKYNFHPEYACFEPGFVRLGAAMHRAYPDAPAPIYSFRFAEELTLGLPPTEWALDAYVRLLALEAPGAHWMAASMGGDITPLIPAIVARGGGVRTGLEDAPMGTRKTNVDLVKECVRAIRAAGGEPATGSEVRAELRR